MKLAKNKLRINIRLLIIKNEKILLVYDADDKFYYYLGGGIEYRETIKQACIREVAEECDGAQFTLEKLLYVRDFLYLQKNHHSIELFLLGTIDKNDELEGHIDPEKPHQYQTWIPLEKLPEINVLPQQLTSRILESYKNGFKGEDVYLGEM